MRSGRRVESEIIASVSRGLGGREGPRRRFPPSLIALALAVPVIPIVVGLLLTAGSGGGAPASAAGSTTAQPKALTFRPRPLRSTARQLSPLPPGSGAVVAQIVKPTVMRASPGGRAIAKLGVRSDFGSPAVALVRAHRRGWLGVISTQSGNNRLGWVPQTATALTRVAFEIRVSLGARRLTVLDGGKVLERYTVAVGRPSAPTPTGRFEVTDRLAAEDPNGPYGCCVLALSAVSPHAIQGWGGGDRIAIHSTPETWSIGQPVSHGCLRLTMAQGRWLMTHIPLGTPTVITS
jgi:lipoprotein-anchoring transpeptidase ErfK/SrfK